MLRDGLDKEDGQDIGTENGILEGNQDRKADGPELGGMVIIGNIDRTALGYSLCSQQ